MAIICPNHKLIYVMVPGTGCSVVGRVLQERFGGTWLPERPVRKDGRVILRRKHNTVAELMRHGVISESEIDNYLVFANVRNPFDRWVTYYQRYVGDWLSEQFAFQRRKMERDREVMDLSEEELKQRKGHIAYKRRRQTRRQRIMRMVGFNNWMKVTLIRWCLEGCKNGFNDSCIKKYAFPMLEGVHLAISQEKLEDGLNQLLRRAGIDETVELPRKNITEGKKQYQDYYSLTTRWLAKYLLGDTMESFGYGFDGRIDDRLLFQLTSSKVSKR